MELIFCITMVFCLPAILLAQNEGGYGYNGDTSGYFNGNSGHEHQFYSSPPHYTFQVAVNDPKTGEVRNQHETKEGDTVKGFYSFKEADGSVREVHYTADKHNGFNAVVKKRVNPSFKF